MDSSLQRTFELQIPCTCCDVHCQRYHGLPMPTAEFIGMLSLYGSSDDAWGRARLYDAYDSAPSGEERVEAFRRLTAPFNSY